MEDLNEVQSAGRSLLENIFCMRQFNMNNSLTKYLQFNTKLLNEELCKKTWQLIKKTQKLRKVIL